MHKNVLFRGCTRPAMFMGVPYLPFFMVAGGTFLFSLYTSMFVLILVPIEIFIMRQMARRDEMIFRLLGLNFQFRLKVRNQQDRGGMWVFSPNGYRNVPAGAKRNFSGPFVISGKMTDRVKPRRTGGTAAA